MFDRSPPAMPMAKCPIENQYRIGNRLRGIVTKGCPYIVIWHVADGRYHQWLFLVTNDQLERLPTVKHYLCALNSHLSVRSVAESLPKEGWSEVEFPVVWEEKEIACLAF